jgi:methyl-accepting chemotaxis protein
LLELTNLAALQADDMLVSIPETSRKDEIGILTNSMKSHQEQTVRIVEGLSSIGRSLNDLMERLKNKSQSLTSTTTSQAPSSEEIRASVEEMQSLTENSSQEASKAASELLKAGKEVEQYVAQNREAMDHMQLLIDRSTIISELASQTYILSVNASIEASRSETDNNKGFATIARAMRELAERVKAVSDEINDLTEKRQKTSDKAISNLNSINNIISQNGDILQSIATMSMQQNAEVSQISGAIQQLNMETQNTAQMAEAMTNEASRLGAHVDELQEMLTFYRKTGKEESSLPQINHWEWAELFASDENENNVELVQKELYN